jgi:hypothetical protein
MKFSLFKEYGALNSKPIFAAFEQSLKSKGYTVVENDLQADVAVIWSVLWNGRMLNNKTVWQVYRNSNRPVVILEVGGIQRGITWKVGLNGIDRNSTIASKGQDSSRANKFNLTLKPWKTDGRIVLICGQHEKSLLWQNQPSMKEWFEQICEQVREVSNMPIIYRPHPRYNINTINDNDYQELYKQDPVKIQGTYDDYNLNFSNVWATVNWNSNPGPQSIIQGIPAFVGPTSLAYDVSNYDLKNIENPHRPDRTQWLNDYAWTEFTIEEIAKGLPIDLLTPLL